MPTKKTKAPGAKAGPRKLTGSLEEDREIINIMYYGDGGTAKTTNMARAAHEGKILFINAERGLKKTPLRKLGVPIQNIVPFNRITWKDLDEVFWSMKGDLEDDPDSWAGVALDSATATTKIMTRLEVEKAVVKAERDGKERELFFTDRADYGVMTEQVRDLIRKFCDLPCHFMVSALERRDVDDDGRVKYGPSVTPALQTDFYGWVDVVCHTEVLDVPGWGEEGEMFVGHFRPIGKYKAKDRLKIVPRTLVEPSMDRLRQYLIGELTVETDKLQIDAREARRLAETEGGKGKRKKVKPTVPDEDDEEAEDE